MRDIMMLDKWVSNRIEPLCENEIKVSENKNLKLLNHVASKSYFYNELYKGIIDNLSSWSEVPIISDEVLKTRDKELLCTSLDSISRIVTLNTSGTTGEPKRIYFTDSDQRNTVEYFKIGMSTFTKENDKVLIFMPCEKEASIGKLLANAISKINCIPYEYGVITDMDEAIDTIMAIKPNVLVGIPFQIMALAKTSKLRNMNISWIDKVLLSTDAISETLVKEVQNILECEVYRYYGLTEAGYGGAIECNLHDGYHLYTSDFIFEIIDPFGTDILPDGEYGEVVITTLKREAMPLIRYRTGDISRIIPQPCACGSSLKRLDKILYRKGCGFEIEDYYLNNNDIDEALLDFENIVDYTAGCSMSDNEYIIKITAYNNSKKDFKTQIYERIKRKIIENKIGSYKKVKVDIELVTVDTNYCPAPNKRVIKTF